MAETPPTVSSPSPFAAPPPDRSQVVVIGGGIAGTSAAFHLASAGIETLLLERGSIGEGATAAAIGVLSPPLRQPFHETVHFRGVETARRIWAFALRSVAAMGGLIESMGAAAEAALDLGGGHILADAHSLHEVEESYRGLAEAGFPVSWMEPPSVRDVTHGRGFLGGYRLEGGGSIAPGATARVLARAASSAGATVAKGVSVGDARRREGCMVVETDQGEVRAEMVVYATHVDSRRFSHFLGDEIVPIRGQGMVTEPGVTRVRGSYATHWKMNVWRTDAEGRLYLGGWRHDAWDRSYWKTRPEVDDGLQEGIQGWYQAAFPEHAPLRVARRWSGIFGWTADYLPLVGPLPGRTGELVISGFSGGGLPFAFEAGRVIASIISGGEPIDAAELLNPRRFT